MYFIVDTTKQNNDGSPLLVTMNSIPEFVQYLNKLCERKFRLTREQYIIDQADLVGYTENSDAVFYDLLRNHFKMGIVRRGVLAECNVLQSARDASNRTEQGD